MRINPILYGVFVLTVFFGIILGFQTAGVWSISGKVDANGAPIAPSAGDVNTIKGWMTLEQISMPFNIPMAELLAQFDIPADTPGTTAIKDLESETFDTAILRDWLQSRIVTDNEPQAVPAQPVSATPLEPVQEPPANLATTFLEASNASVAKATPVPTQHVATVTTITGKTTFQELLDWGVSHDTIQKVIGGNLPTPSTVIKDYVTSKGLEFSTMKTNFQAEVDKLNP